MMTPAPQSGMNTPFYSQSRAGSVENLTTMSGDVHPAGAVLPAALSSRLQNLDAGSRNNSFRYLAGASSGANTPHHHSHPENDANGSNQPGQPHEALSRRVSEEENHGAFSNLTSGQHTPEHIDFRELGDLTKVPSYRTAVKTPARDMSCTDSLPNYDAAVLARPSAVPASSNSATSRAGESSTNHLDRNSMTSIGFTPINEPPPAHLGEGDERRRLFVLQNRGRAH